MNVQDANGCTIPREHPLARRHRKLLEAADRVKAIVETEEAKRVRTLGPEDMADQVHLTFLHSGGPCPCADPAGGRPCSAQAPCSYAAKLPPERWAAAPRSFPIGGLRPVRAY